MTTRRRLIAGAFAATASTLLARLAPAKAFSKPEENAIPREVTYFLGMTYEGPPGADCEPYGFENSFAPHRVKRVGRYELALGGAMQPITAQPITAQHIAELSERENTLSYELAEYFVCQGRSGVGWIDDRGSYVRPNLAIPSNIRFCLYAHSIERDGRGRIESTTTEVVFEGDAPTSSRLSRDVDWTVVLPEARERARVISDEYHGVWERWLRSRRDLDTQPDRGVE